MYLRLNLFLERYEAIMMPLCIRFPQIICIILCSQPNSKSRLEVLMFIFYLFCKKQEKDGEKPNQVLPLSESPYSVAGRRHCLATSVACVISVVSLG